jgi:hypothetical protein
MDFTEIIGFYNDRCLILQYIILTLLNGVVVCSNFNAWAVEECQADRTHPLSSMQQGASSAS